MDGWTRVRWRGAPDDDHLLEGQLVARVPVVVQEREGEDKGRPPQHRQQQQHAEEPHCLAKVGVLRRGRYSVTYQTLQHQRMQGGGCHTQEAPKCQDTLAIEVADMRLRPHPSNLTHGVSCITCGTTGAILREVAPFSTATGQWQHMFMCHAGAGSRVCFCHSMCQFVHCVAQSRSKGGPTFHLRGSSVSMPT